MCPLVFLQVTKVFFFSPFVSRVDVVYEFGANDTEVLSALPIPFFLHVDTRHRYAGAGMKDSEGQ